DLSCRYGKTVLVFDPGDKIYSIPIQNFIVFHTWQYRFEKKQNEIIIPAISEDVGRGRDIIRHKNTSHKPSVGFCGWAAFPSVRVFFSAYWRKVVIFFQTILTGNKKLFVKNKGLLFRRAILKKLKRSNRVVSNFIIRKSFGSNKLTIKGSAEKARAEYIDNIANTDFSLAIRGDGNYSIRFYEILSMGRIPVLFDTECVFPMEKETDYDSIILRINISDIDKIDDKIFEFYDRLSDDDFIERQRRARDLFLNELYYPVFLKYLFADKQNIQSLLG
ncbi:MAG: hypothetical protein NT003_02435, partial [Candidatus Magasanikbacteria bacterium]|nr:hypothetical protein [Candidatus Magasanikbacteria bacterium]